MMKNVHDYFKNESMIKSETELKHSYISTNIEGQ